MCPLNGSSHDLSKKEEALVFCSSNYFFFPIRTGDRNGNLHVAYLHLLNPTEGIIRYATRSAGTWSFANVDTLADLRLGFTGARRIVALEIDESDQAHVVYGDRSVVKYAVGTPGNWIIDKVLDESGTSLELGQQVDMARCGDDGSIHLVYYEASFSSNTVWYARPGLSVDVEDPPLANAFQLSVYPNPSADAVTIAVSGHLLSREMSKITVIDALGRRILSRIVSSEDQRLFLNDLAPGTYFVEAQYGRKKRTSSFVVNR